MPEISLRAYVREIDELIEAEKFDEAIAHSRYILQTYPKHLETYRLLGKSYLEAKRYGDAADIFQRVLSAVPDDFVAHIGMAIVREDEGNLDAAIWHMERAFETNPANPAIQQELRRLIGRRDGLEPHKVRLTRGALARMYAHGELYQQAITELRSALQEDPERPDLQVLLANMYWRLDQRSEALALCNRILEKLPYCLQANRILAASLQAKERIEEAAVYHRRLASLDPYAAYAEAAMADSDTIEPSIVSMERLDWQPGEPIPTAGVEQPGWAASLGMELQEREAKEAAEAGDVQKTGPLPSWLEPGEPPPFVAPEAGFEAKPAFEADSGLADLVDSDDVFELDLPVEPEEAEVEPAAVDLEAEPEDEYVAETYAEEEPAAMPESEPAAEIPEWMRDAGWSESEGEVPERPVSFSDEELATLDAGELPVEPSEEPQAEGELTPAKLPGWIHDIAPAEDFEAEEEVSVEGPAGEVPDWLDEVSPAAEVPQEAEAPSPEPAAVEAGEPLDQLTEPEAEIAEEAAGDSIASEIDSREWPTWISDEAPGATDTIVTWLTDREGQKEPDEDAASKGVPEWMQDTGPLAKSPTDAEAGDAEESPPEWLQEMQTQEAPDSEQAAAEPEPATATPAEEAGAPNWLSAVAEAAARESPSPEQESGVEPEEPPPPSDLPPVEEPEELVPASPPDWISQLAPAEDEQADALEPQMEMIEDLEQLVEEDLPTEDAPQPAEPGADDEVQAPDWLEGLAESVKGSEQVPELPEAVPPEPPEVVPPEPAAEQIELGPDDSTEIPDWLKGLAEERPGAEPAVPASGAPDWLRQIVEPAEQPELEGAAEIEPTVPAGEELEAPDWLRGVPEEPPAREEPSISELDAEPSQITPPDWMQPEQPEPTPEPEPPAPEPEPELPMAAASEAGDEDEVISWLEDLAAKQAEEEEEPAEELGGRIAVGALPQEPLVEERQLPEEPEEGLEWLEQLAEQRGMDIDVTAPPAVEQPEEVAEPSWTATPEPAGAEDEVPEWLERMATAPTIPIPRDELDKALETSIDEPARTAEPEPAEQYAEPEPVAEAPEEEIPDWLAEMAAEGPPTAEEPEEVVEPAEVVPPSVAEEPVAAPEEVLPPAEEPPMPIEAPAAQPPAAPEAEPTPVAEVVPPQPVEAAEAIEPTPPIAEPAEVREEPTPIPAPPPGLPEAQPEPTPAAVEPVATVEPVAAEPPAAEPPTVAEPEPAVAEPEPAVAEPEPAVAEPEPAVAEPEPAKQVTPAIEPTELVTPEPVAVSPPPAAAEAPAVEVEAPEPKKRREFDAEQTLEQARQALAAGESGNASKLYGQLTKRKRQIDSVIEDLRTALDRSPDDPILWQTLGDAYMKVDRTSEAIEAYRRGMEAA